MTMTMIIDTSDDPLPNRQTVSVVQINKSEMKIDPYDQGLSQCHS